MRPDMELVLPRRARLRRTGMGAPKRHVGSFCRGHPTSTSPPRTTLDNIIGPIGDDTTMDPNMSRRRLLQRTAALSALAVFGAEACGKSHPSALVCTDTTGLSPSDLSVRNALAYVDVSPTPGKTCSTCQQFV